MNEDLNTSPPSKHDYVLNTEINTGQTFYDGRPIYRVYIESTSSNKINESKSINESISNFDRPISSDVYVYTPMNDTYCFRPLGYVMCTANPGIYGEYSINIDGRITVRMNSSNFLNCPVYAVMDYVKKKSNA